MRGKTNMSKTKNEKLCPTCLKGAIPEGEQECRSCLSFELENLQSDLENVQGELEELRGRERWLKAEIEKLEALVEDEE
jgi:hypothetical protein